MKEKKKPKHNTAKFRLGHILVRGLTHLLLTLGVIAVFLTFSLVTPLI